MAAIYTRTATFDGTQPLDGDQPYVDVSWPSLGTLANVRIGTGVQVDDGNGQIGANHKSLTLTGCRVLASAHFTGKVYVTVTEFS